MRIRVLLTLVIRGDARLSVSTMECFQPIKRPERLRLLLKDQS